MDIRHGFILNFILVHLLLALVHSQRTKDKMYENIIGTKGCYRRLNSTHQIGCTSKRGGSAGVIHYCKNLDDLHSILTKGTAGPYVPVLPTKLFTAEAVDKLITSQQVSGLILHPNNETLNSFTHENQCPNPRSSLENTCSKNSTWNPFGTGLIYRDIPFPIFYVESEEEIDKMRKCFEKFNNFDYDNQKDRSLCSLELRSFMYATTNSQTCRRRSNIVTNLNPITFCDPLGDNNVWAALYPLVKGPRNETEPIADYKYIVVAARMDTTSMFEKTSGANSPVTGIVTLLYTAKLLKSMLSEDDIQIAKKNVLFVLFNGETFDYIGSQRMVYDMQQGNFPIKGLEENNNVLPVIRPENISLFIELSQLGDSKDRDLFVHYLKQSKEIESFYDKLKYNEDTIHFQNVPLSVPPASLHSFLRNNSDFPGLVISDHERSYTNTFYNSIYDNASNVGYDYNLTEDQVDIPNSIQQFIVNVSEIVARSVYSEITDLNYTGEIATDVVLVNELFHCYLEDPNCKVHSATQKAKWSKTPSSLYVGVDRVSNHATTLTSLTLAWFTGTVEGKADINCTNKPRNYAYRYFNMSKSIYELNVTLCYKVTMNLTEAKSPAFLIEDYDWSSGQYSSWTESIWWEMGVRMFLRPSAAHEKMTIAIGSMSMIFSFIVVYFVKSRSHILFTPPLPSEAPADC